MIFTVIRCIRDSIRFKVLYIVMMVFLLYFGFSYIGSEIDLQFGFWVGWRSSGLTIFENGDFYTLVMVPAGAIIYWCIRNGLIRKTETRNVKSMKQRLEELDIEDDNFNA